MTVVQMDLDRNGGCPKVVEDTDRFVEQLEDMKGMCEADGPLPFIVVTNDVSEYVRFDEYDVVAVLADEPTKLTDQSGERLNVVGADGRTQMTHNQLIAEGVDYRSIGG